jgi:hypothetical protein
MDFRNLVSILPDIITKDCYLSQPTRYDIGEPVCSPSGHVPEPSVFRLSRLGDSQKLAIDFWLQPGLIWAINSGIKTPH